MDFILGLVFLVVTYWSLKGTVLKEYNGEKCVEERIVPMWFLFALGLLYLIPGFGIIIFVVYNIIFLAFATRKPKRYYYKIILQLSDRNILHRILGAIIHFLNKGI